jgi:hypothetical protein
MDPANLGTAAGVATKVLVALGGTALKALLGPSATVAKARGC